MRTTGAGASTSVPPLRRRQPDAPPKASQRARRGLQPSAMRIDNGLDDGEAEPRTSAGPRARFIHTIEPVGEPLQVLLWYTRWRVLPVDARLPRVLVKTHAQLRRGFGVTQC